MCIKTVVAYVTSNQLKNLEKNMLELYFRGNLVKVVCEFLGPMNSSTRACLESLAGGVAGLMAGLVASSSDVLGIVVGLVVDETDVPTGCA